MTKDIHNSLHGYGRHDGKDEWDRWDEDLVDDFGYWLTMFGKAFAILLLLVIAFGLITWIANLF
jgi:hypothetical protein